MPQRGFATACARIRMPLFWGSAAVMVAVVVLGALIDLPGGGVLAWSAMGLLAVGLAVYLRVGTPRGEPVTVTPPVTGRWLVANSPASRVPSHGMHAYGQSYAIDLVLDPPDHARPRFTPLRPLARRPEEFPAFGVPVRAPVDGVVVRVHDRERDHWSRNSLPALLYLVAEGTVREFTGPNRILGNHVVVETPSGVFAALAHLRRGSVRVREGQRVTVGEHLASCGNSGNSSEPHLHFQLMDHRHPAFAAGVPFRFRPDGDGTPSGLERGGVPRGGSYLDVPEDASTAPRQDQPAG